MTNLSFITAIIIGKLTGFFLKLAGTGGTAAPGLIALKICPSLIRKLSSQLEKNILVTGTNGKTTTARMTANILKEANIKVIHNRYGSNLLRGIASALIKNSSLFGKMPKNYLGLWETDEAAFLPACQEVKPEIILITNLFRDQLDRYGEIDTVASKWQKALTNLSEDSFIILNADDATVASLGKSEPRDHLERVVPSRSRLGRDAATGGKRRCDPKKNKTLYFGLADKKLGNKKPDHASDATVCPYCFSELKYQACFVSHLGSYSCSQCGQIQPKKDIYLESIKISNGITSVSILDRGFLRSRIGDKEQTFIFKTTLPGTYNLYNFTAATALTIALKIPKDTIIKGLTSFTPAFGRVEKIKMDNKTLNIFLVKNPTGFNEVIDTLVNTGCYRQLARLPTPGVEKLTCLIAINDLIADGTDISWLWDVNFEKLAPQLKKVIVSGIRAHDMALRLKYATYCSVIASKAKQSLKYNNITIEPNLKKAINQLLKTNNQQLYILPTYTAMLEIRKILNKMGLVHSSWED